MINLHSKTVGFCLVMVLVLHNLDSCTGIEPYYDKQIEQQQTPSSLSSQEEKAEHISAPKTKAESNSSSDVSDSTPVGGNNKTATLPPKVFPTNSPNSSVPIVTIADCTNVTRFLASANDNSSSAPVYVPTPPSSATAASADAEAYDMVNSKRYDGEYDVDEVKGIAKKYNHTKEVKNVTKPPSVVDSKKDAKVDSNKNGTKSLTPEVTINNKTVTAATAEDASKTEAKSSAENRNKTAVAVGKTEEERKVEANTVVTEPPQIVLPPQKSGSTLREVGRTLAAILVTIVGTASMLFVGFLMWRRISRRYYGHREMLINEDDFEEVSDLHHFEGATDTPPSHTIISQR